MFKLKKIGVVGSTTIDKIVTGDESGLKLGGVTTYAGITYCRQGIPAVIASNVAHQDRLILNALKTEKIDVFRGATDRTTHFVNYTQGHRRRQEIPQRASPIFFDQIQSILDRVDGLHLGPLHPHDIDPAAFSLLHQSDLPIFLDVQGFTRVVKNRYVYPSVSDHLTAALGTAQVIKANEDEYHAILEFYHLNLLEIMMRFKIDESLVTLGENGGFVQTRDGKIFKYAADYVGTPDDSTGAGDVFFAVYISNRYSKQMQISDACRNAARIAARQVEGNFISLEKLGLE